MYLMKIDREDRYHLWFFSVVMLKLELMGMDTITTFDNEVEARRKRWK